MSYWFLHQSLKVNIAALIIMGAASLILFLYDKYRKKGLFDD